MRKQKFPVNSNIFLSENSMSFYLLGAYMTDGNIIPSVNKIEINSKDEEWIKQIRNVICPNKTIYSSKRSACFTLKITDENSLNWLNSWGCTPNKSKTLTITKQIPDEFKKDFLRGVIDGDGSISTSQYNKKYKNKIYTYNKINVYICSASERFISDLKLLIPENIKCSIYKTKPQISFIKGRKINSNPCYRIIFNEQNAKKILEYTYYADAKIAMIRKSILANKIIL